MDGLIDFFVGSLFFKKYQKSVIKHPHYYALQKMSPAADTRKPPSWLNSSFFEKTLSKPLNEPLLKVAIKNMVPAVAVGDNYVSILFRATLQLTRTPTSSPENFSVICKTLPQGDAIQNLIKETKIFEKEAKVLMDILPEINRLLKRVELNHTPLSAECYYFGTDPEEVLLMQDLKEEEFQILDR